MKNIWLSLAANKRIPEVVSCQIVNNCVQIQFKSGNHMTFHEELNGSTYVIWYENLGNLTSLEIQVANLISFIVFSSMSSRLKDQKYYFDRYDRYLLGKNVKSEVEDVAINALYKHFCIIYIKK